MRYKHGYVTSPIKVTDANLSGNGTVIRKVDKSTLWTKHTVDQQAGLIRKRYGTRSAGAYKQYGMAYGYDHLTALDFMRGVGYIPGAGAVVINALNGSTVAVARIADAMAYRIAALRRGVLLEVYNV